MTDTPPRFATDGFRPEFAEFAAWMLEQRELSYPALVDKGRMLAADARRRIEIMRMIAEIWHSADRGPLIVWTGGSVSRADIVGELENAIDVSARKVAADPENRLLVDRHDALICMLWWHRRYKHKSYYHHEMACCLRADALALAIETEREAERRAAAQSQNPERKAA